MGYMAGVTDDPYTSVGGDKPIAVYDKFVYGFGTSARMLNVYVQFGQAEDGTPLVSMERGFDGTWCLCEESCPIMEVEFAIVAMAVYWHGESQVTSNSYEGIVERASALVAHRISEFITYGHRSIGLEEHPKLFADIIEYLMPVK